MNIINTIKKFFKLKTDTGKINLPMSSTDNIIDKNTLECLDTKIQNIESLIQGLINYTNIRTYTVDTSQNEDFSAAELSVVETNNIVVMSGRLASKRTLHYQYYIDLPVNLRPMVSYVGYWAPVVVDGIEYKFHIMIYKNDPSRLNIYSYDEFPAQNSIVFQLVFALDNKPY